MSSVQVQKDFTVKVLIGQVTKYQAENLKVEILIGQVIRYQTMEYLMG